MTAIEDLTQLFLDISWGNLDPSFHSRAAKILKDLKAQLAAPPTELAEEVRRIALIFSQGITVNPSEVLTLRKAANALDRLTAEAKQYKGMIERGLKYTALQRKCDNLKAEAKRQKENALTVLGKLDKNLPDEIVDPVYSLSVTAIGLEAKITKLTAEAKDYHAQLQGVGVEVLELKKENKRLKEQHRWIPVGENEKLPKLSIGPPNVSTESVWLIFKGKPQIGYYTNFDGWRVYGVCFQERPFSQKDITYWKPIVLPEPNKQEG